MENGRDEEGDVQDDSKCCRAVIKEQWKKVAEEFSMEKEAAFIKVCGDEQQRFSVKFGGVYCEFNSRFISEPYVLGFGSSISVSFFGSILITILHSIHLK